MPPSKKPMHEMQDSPDNPKVYGKPSVPPRDNLPMSDDMDKDTRPNESTPWQGTSDASS